MEWDVYKTDFEKKASEKLEWQEGELSKIRPGKVSSSNHEDVFVDFFGSIS